MPTHNTVSVEKLICQLDELVNERITERAKALRQQIQEQIDALLEESTDVENENSRVSTGEAITH